MLALYVKRLSMSIGNSLITTGKLNIRIHRDITGLPPSVPARATALISCHNNKIPIIIELSKNPLIELITLRSQVQILSPLPF
jgi:hypothetical protein